MITQEKGGVVLFLFFLHSWELESGDRHEEDRSSSGHTPEVWMWLPRIVVYVGLSFFTPNRAASSVIGPPDAEARLSFLVNRPWTLPIPSDQLLMTLGGAPLPPALH